MKLLSLVVLASLFGCGSCGGADNNIELEDTMNLSQLPQVPTEGIMNLASSVNDDGELIFSGRSSISTRVVAGGALLTAPFSGVPCVFYDVEVFYETPQEIIHIGGKESAEDFFTFVNGSLVKVDLTKIESAPQVNQTYQSADAPERIKQALSTLGWLEETVSHPAFTVVEKTLSTDPVYSLTVRRSEYTLPPETPNAEPVSGASYEFKFSD